MIEDKKIIQSNIDIVNDNNNSFNNSSNNDNTSNIATYSSPIKK
jgi:hypothetical protein